MLCEDVQLIILEYYHHLKFKECLNEINIIFNLSKMKSDVYKFCHEMIKSKASVKKYITLYYRLSSLIRYIEINEFVFINKKTTCKIITPVNYHFEWKRMLSDDEESK